MFKHLMDIFKIIGIKSNDAKMMGCEVVGSTNKNHLIVDEDVRHVIELIFNLCVNGIGAPTIAKVSEEKGILNPAAYKTLKGSTRFAKLQ